MPHESADFLQFIVSRVKVKLGDMFIFSANQERAWLFGISDGLTTESRVSLMMLPLMHGVVLDYVERVPLAYDINIPF